MRYCLIYSMVMLVSLLGENSSAVDTGGKRVPTDPNSSAITSHHEVELPFRTPRKYLARRRYSKLISTKKRRRLMPFRVDRPRIEYYSRRYNDVVSHSGKTSKKTINVNTGKSRKFEIGIRDNRERMPSLASSIRQISTAKRENKRLRQNIYPEHRRRPTALSSSRDYFSRNYGGKIRRLDSLFLPESSSNTASSIRRMSSSSMLKLPPNDFSRNLRTPLSLPLPKRWTKSSYTHHAPLPHANSYSRTIKLPSTAGQTVDLNNLIKFVRGEPAAMHRSSKQGNNPSYRGSSRIHPPGRDPVISYIDKNSSISPHITRFAESFLRQSSGMKSPVKVTSYHNTNFTSLHSPLRDLRALPSSYEKTVDLRNEIRKLLLSPDSSLDLLGNPAFAEMTIVSNVISTSRTPPVSTATMPLHIVQAKYYAVECGAKETSSMQLHEFLYGLICKCQFCHDCEARQPNSTSPSDVECGSKQKSQLCCCCDSP